MEGKWSDFQHGFRQGRSCLSNLLGSMEQILEMKSESNCSDVLYFDFQKAFDHVSHYRLISKMSSYGIDQTTVNIVKDFLSDRTMQVRVGNSYSEIKMVTSGVPQGSVLGPLLFLIFINDLPNNMVAHCEIFVNDIKLIVNPKEREQVLQDLKRLETWQEVSNMRLNLDKCKVLQLGKSNPYITYPFMGGVLKNSNCGRDLGVNVDNNLTFQQHISIITTKAKKKMHWILNNLVTREEGTMLKVYKALIRPNLEYCTQLLSSITKMW